MIASVVATSVGVISAVRQDTWMDYAARRSAAIALLAIPAFWLGNAGW